MTDEKGCSSVQRGTAEAADAAGYRLSGKESTGRCAMLSTAASRNPIITEFREAAVESMPPNLVHYFSEDR